MAVVTTTSKIENESEVTLSFDTVAAAQAGDTGTSTHLIVTGLLYEYDASGTDLTTGDSRTWTLKVVPIAAGGTAGATVAAARTSLGLGTGDTPEFTGIALSGGASVLADYEEGTWTPEVADASTGGNTATGTMDGHYTRIGRVVTLYISCAGIDTTGLTAGNDLWIRGLPFTHEHLSGANHTQGGVRLSNITFNGSPSLSMLDQIDAMRIAESISGSPNDFVTVSEVTSGSANIYGTLVYFTSD